MSSKKDKGRENTDYFIWGEQWENWSVKSHSQVSKWDEEQGKGDDDNKDVDGEKEKGDEKKLEEREMRKNTRNWDKNSADCCKQQVIKEGNERK